MSDPSPLAQAQAIIREFLKPNTTAYLFSPQDSRAWHDSQRRAGRKSPMTPSQASRRRKSRPKRSPGEKYEVPSYGHAIKYGARKAGVPHWTPNQLRHSVATLVHSEFGLEESQVVMGHTKADVTQIYAQRNEKLAFEVAGKIG
ncbi:MAG: tyrosine-type recombinase/integrase [Pirellulales bacterium]